MPGENSNSAAKRIFVGTVVRGSHGDFIEDAGSNERKRRRREKVSGRVEAVVGRNVYRVRFEKVGVKVVNSRTLAIISNAELNRAILQANNDPTQETPLLANAGSLLSSEEGDCEEEEEHLPQPGDLQDDEELGELGAVDDEDDDERNEVINIGDINASANLDEIERTQRYEQRKRDTAARITSLCGTEVDIKQTKTNQRIVWRVVKECHPPDHTPDRTELDLAQFGMNAEDQYEVRFALMFLMLTFDDWQGKLDLMNEKIIHHNCLKTTTDHKVVIFTPHEFLTALGLFIGASRMGCKGADLWAKAEDNDDIMPSPNFQQYMKDYRFREWRKFVPFVWSDPKIRETDPWWMISAGIQSFNNRMRALVKSSVWRILDESMSAWRPRTTDTGALPNISFVARKPEPLGTEFKAVCCPKTKVMLALEIQRGKAGMKDQAYVREFGATAACTLRLADTVFLGDGYKEGVKGDAWSGSVKGAPELGKQGKLAVLQIKMGFGLFPKKFVEETLKDAPGGTLFLREHIPMGQTLLRLFI
ncbi:MAG: hypothetical protein ACREOZ_05245, partial [Gloeomargaritales cyanobacterium]